MATNVVSITGYPNLPVASLRHDDRFLVADVHAPLITATGPPGATPSVTKSVTLDAVRGAKVFYLDDYGADPSGVNLSDSAWAAAYSAATNALLAHSGAMIIAGAGTYLFSVGKVVITDSRIGFLGQGNAATMIFSTGNNGILLQFNGLTGGPGNAAAPIGGFTVYGWSGGNGLSGIQYGDRANWHLVDVTATGFNGTNGRGFWFRDTIGLSEGSYMVLNADQNTINYDFDTSGGGVGSFDYSSFFLHLVATTVGGISATGLRFSAGQHCFGGRIHLVGNASATTGLTTTVVAVGTSGSDTARIQACDLHVMVEADTSAGTVKDIVVQGASSNAGIIQCAGHFVFLNAGGSYTIGSVGSPAVVTGWGHFLGPLFSGHGTLTAIGSAGAGLWTYLG